MKLGIVKTKNTKIDVILFKYNKLDDVILFDVLNFSDHFEPPEYIKELHKIKTKEKILKIFQDDTKRRNSKKGS